MRSLLCLESPQYADASMSMPFKFADDKLNVVVWYQDEFECRSCFLSSGKGFQAGNYTTPAALQALLRAFGFSVASPLAEKSLESLEQAIRKVYAELHNHREVLTALFLQLKVSSLTGQDS